MKKADKTVWIATPFLMLILWAGMMILLGIKPYEQFEKYLNLAFMDTLKTTEGSQGLSIQEKEISTEEQQGSESGTAKIPQFGEQYAVLSCEAIDLYVPVFWGNNAELLGKGACQATNSVPAGADGNVVIDAHVNTYFARLSELQVGDTLALYTEYGKFTYEVTECVTFNKDDKTYVRQDGKNVLTLYTCKAQLLGSSNERQAVVCKPLTAVFY